MAAGAGMTVLAAQSVSVALGGRTVLEGVDAQVAPRTLTALVGPNGAGKTTLLRLLAGQLAPDSGTVTLDGTPLDQVPARLRARDLAYLPQGGEAVWPIAVRELVMLGRLPYRKPFAGPGAEDRRAVDAALSAMHVAALGDRPVTELSGGERARVLLARALAGAPKILLADEPVAGLDPYHALDVMERLRALAADGAAVMVVLHDLTLAARFCDRVVLLKDGRLAEEGPPGTALAPERVAAVYGVDVVAGEHDGEPYILPWSRRG